MSWTAPANRGDVLFLEPSLKYLHRKLDFTPWLVLGGMAYVKMAAQKRLREELQVGVLTHLLPNLVVPAALAPALLLQCHQGQKLRWLGLHPEEQLHWFGVDPEAECLCSYCWQRSGCAREFCFRPEDHEIVLGTVPLNTRVGRRLLKQSRSWIEAAQSYEKNQLGLGQFFLNSLRLTAVMCLLADTVCLLRAHAVVNGPPRQRDWLQQLRPNQLTLDLA